MRGGPRSAHAVDMTVYTIVVKGELSDRFGRAFDGMTLHAGDGETALVGDIVDQAQLQGVLSRVADLGLVLLRVSQSDRTHQAGRIPPHDRSRGKHEQSRDAAKAKALAV